MHNNREKIIVLTDIGRDPDDMLAFILASYLAKQYEIEIVAAVSTLTPSIKRAQLAEYTRNEVSLDSFLVGAGSDLPTLKEEHVHDYEFSALPKIDYKTIDAWSVFKNALTNASDKSLTMLVIAAFTDLSGFLQSSFHCAELFKQKVNKVVIMGGIATDQETIYLNKNGFLEPDNSANYGFDPDAASFAITFFQKHNIPIVFVSRFCAYASQLPRQVFDDIQNTGHCLGYYLFNVAQTGFQLLWNRANLPLGDESRSLPDRCDRQWFLDTFCDGIKVTDDKNIWPYIKKISAYDPLALIACSSKLSRKFFVPQEIKVGEVNHQVIGLSKDDSGVRDARSLVQFVRDGLIEALTHAK